jgi:flagellar hook-associated protein 2
MDTDVENSAHAVLGLADGTSTEGTDVAGTINGEAAEGRGRYLTGAEDNETTAGVKLHITLGPSQVNSGAEGSITLSRGIASQTYAYLNDLTAPSDGVFDTKIRGLKTQIDDLKEQITDLDERLAMRRETLMQQFWDMENALSEMNSQMNYLSSISSQLGKNWQFSGLK